VKSGELPWTGFYRTLAMYFMRPVTNTDKLELGKIALEFVRSKRNFKLYLLFKDILTGKVLDVVVVGTATGLDDVVPSLAAGPVKTWGWPDDTPVVLAFRNGVLNLSILNSQELGADNMREYYLLGEMVRGLNDLPSVVDYVQMFLAPEEIFNNEGTTLVIDGVLVNVEDSYPNQGKAQKRYCGKDSEGVFRIFEQGPNGVWRFCIRPVSSSPEFLALREKVENFTMPGERSAEESLKFSETPLQSGGYSARRSQLLAMGVDLSDRSTLATTLKYLPMAKPCALSLEGHAPSNVSMFSKSPGAGPVAVSQETEASGEDDSDLDDYAELPATPTVYCVESICGSSEAAGGGCGAPMGVRNVTPVEFNSIQSEIFSEFVDHTDDEVADYFIKAAEDGVLRIKRNYSPCSSCRRSC